MTGKFEVYEDKRGDYRFRLKDAVGMVLAGGEPYVTKAAAKKGCESVAKAADGAPIVDLDQDPGWRRAGYDGPDCRVFDQEPGPHGSVGSERVGREDGWRDAGYETAECETYASA